MQATDISPNSAARRLKDMGDSAHETLYSLMRVLRMTDQAVADASGSTKQTIHNKRHGRAKIRVGDLWPLSFALDIPMEVLLMEPDEAIIWAAQNRRDRVTGSGPCSSVDSILDALRHDTATIDPTWIALNGIAS